MTTFSDKKNFKMIVSSEVLPVFRQAFESSGYDVVIEEALPASMECVVAVTQR